MSHLNLTFLSAVYILSGATGLSISTYALPKYHFSKRAAHLVEDAADRRDAIRINRGILAREYVRLSIHILTTATGVVSLFVIPVPQPPPKTTFDWVFGGLVYAILMWANIGTTINSAIALYEYRLVRRRRVPHGVSVLADLRRRIGRVERRGR